MKHLMKSKGYIAIFITLIFILSCLIPMYTGIYASAQYDETNPIESVNRLFEGVFDWLSELYDPDTGGFYGTVSARDTEGFIPGIEQTAWAISIMSSYGNDLLASVPDETKQKLIEFFQSRQDPDTGLFINTSGPVNDRNTSRNLSAATSALKTLGASPLYPLPGERIQTGELVASSRSAALMDTASSDFDAAAYGLPEYLTNTQAYLEYLETRSWDSDAWTAGDNLQQTVVMLRQLPDDLRQSYINVLLKFCRDTQNSDTGLWGENGAKNFRTLSGALKIFLAYQSLDYEIPNPEKIIASVIEIMQSGDPAGASCYVRNPLTLLDGLKNRSAEISEMIDNNLSQIIASTYNSMASFHIEGGGFSSDVGASQATFSGIPNGLQIYESDIDAVVQMLITRRCIYQLFGMQPAPLSQYYNNFWDKISSKKPIEKKAAQYCAPGQTAFSQDFENIAAVSELSGDFTLQGAGCTYEINEENGNKYLTLTDNATTESGWAGIYFPRITTTAVIEARMKFGHEEAYKSDLYDFSYSGFHVQGGGENAVSINAKEGASSSKLTTVSATSPSYVYSDISDISPDEWVSIRIRITMPKDSAGGDIKTVYYINNELFSVAADKWTGAFSKNYLDRIKFFTSSKRMCTISIDDIKISQAAENIPKDFEVGEVSFVDSRGNTIHTIENGDITSTLKLINTTAEAKAFCFVSAVFDSTRHAMSDAAVSRGIAAPKSTAEFQATVNVTSAENQMIKTFIWESDSLIAHKTATVLSNKSSQKFDDIWLIYQMPTCATEGKKEHRKSYRGIVDEHKGTVTFEIPYGIEDADIIKDTGKLSWASLALTGADTSVVTCTGGVYNGNDSTVSPANGERYTGQVLKQLTLRSGSFTHGGWVKASADDGDGQNAALYGNLNQINMKDERPVITVTAEDGSSVSYKVNIVFSLVDDDFSNASAKSSSLITSGQNSEWSWTRSYKDGESTAAVAEEEGNTFLSLSKDSPASTSNTELRLNLKNEDGTWILLDNLNADRTAALGDNVKVIIDYDFRYRNTIRTDNNTEYGNPYYYAFQCLNGNGNCFAKLEFAQNTNTGFQTRSVSGTVEAGQSYSKNIWYNDTIVLFVDGGNYSTETKSYTGDVYADYYLDGCRASVTNLSAASSITGTAGDNSKDLSLSAFKFTASANSSNERTAVLDLDNLKIGLLFD